MRFISSRSTSLLFVLTGASSSLQPPALSLQMTKVRSSSTKTAQQQQQADKPGVVRKRSTALEALKYSNGDDTLAPPRPSITIKAPFRVGTSEHKESIKFVTTKLLPSLAALTALGMALTSALAPLTSPAAQAIKLVYAGAVAGMISRTFCAPLEMVSTVMMCKGDQVQSMSQELARTWKAEGFRGMFKGNGANCLKVAPSRGTQFLVYEFVKRRMVLLGIGMTAGSMSLNAGSRLCAGGIAGMVAAAIVYPLEVVKTMLTLYPDQCKSIPQAIRTVVQSSGVGGLYRGLGPTLVAMFPYVGVEFMVYETLKRRWEQFIGPTGTLALLILGAIGGAAAQASAHPLDVIRRRMQMQSMNAQKEKMEDDNKTAAKTPKAYSNMFTGLYRVAKDEGWHVLFKGLGPACFEKIPSTAIGYFIYEALKVSLKVSSV